MHSSAKGQVAIVGASLAGLLAARALHEGGVSEFSVFDAKPRVGLPLKCGEAVEAPVMRELFGEAIAQAPFVRNRIEDHQIRYGNSRREFAFPYYELDRPVFEQWLAEPVGDHLHLGTRIQSIRREGGGFRLCASQGNFFAQGLILACGASYGLQRQLGLLHHEPRLGWAWGGIYSSDYRQSEQSFTWELLDDVRGYAWAFPKGGGVFNLGVAGFEPKTLRRALDRFQRQLGDGSAVKPRCTLGGHFPADGAIRHTHADGVLVAGDAAGMVFAGTGEGIAYALLSGKFAGDVMAGAIRDGDLSRRRLRGYPRRWKARFGRRLRAGVRFQRLLVFLIETGQLERVVRAIPEPLLRGMMAEGRIPAWVLLRFAWQNIVRRLRR